MSDITILPMEMLESVFGHLSWPNLASAMRVCRSWKEVGEKPIMWREFELVANITDEMNVEDVEKTLRSKRFSQVRSWKLVDCFRNPENREGQRRQERTKSQIFKLIWQHSTLEMLNITGFKISCIDPEVLSVLPPKLTHLVMNDPEQIDLSYEARANAYELTGLTSNQAKALFSGIKAQDTLTDLLISEDDLTGVNPDLLATVVNKLVKVELRDVGFDQIEAIFSSMAQNSKLKTFVLWDTELSYVDADELAAAVNKLQNFYLYCSPRKEQVEKILRQVLVSTCLKRLVIVFWEKWEEKHVIDGIPKELISEVHQKLDEFEISSCA
eukprot:GFUD01038768.1.p1 GENE.GFUD01038768.1~~GFUD01038768.1.p1  ORF type:complete len:327 (-),score=55.48 GFUD01038768.1:33-1013(-)